MKKQSGVVLISVLITLSLVAIIVYWANRDSAFAVHQVAADTDALQAKYAAEAGLNHAIWSTQNAGCIGDTTIPSTVIGANIYEATLDSTATATNQYTFTPDGDTWIEQQWPDENYGNSAELWARMHQSNERRPLYHFDVSSIPVGTQVTSAIVWFYVTQNSSGGSLNLHPVTTNWTESDATWNSIGTNYEKAAIGIIPPQPSANLWVPVNITALTQEWVNDANNNNGLLLIATSSQSSKYASKEYSPSSNRPYLAISTATGDVSPVSVTAIGTSKNALTSTLVKNAAKAYQTSSEFILQPGPSLKDTYTWDGMHEDRNFGASGVLKIDLPLDHQTALLQFPLESIPLGARILEAKLNLYLESGNGLVNGVVNAHRVVRTWVEGDLDDVDVSNPGDGATHNSYDGDTSNTWNNPGGDYDPTPIDSVTIPSLTPGWVQWNVTSQIKDWLAGETNNGFLLTATGGTLDKIVFTSSDSDTSNQHPYLSLKIACECGQVCTNIKASGNVLMAVGNPSNLHPSTAYYKALMEGWGYTVNLIDDDATQDAYTAAESNNDVAYITESVDHNKLDNKLTNFTIGVINEEWYTIDNLGIAADMDDPVGDTLNVIDNTHYITQPFSIGDLKVFSAGLYFSTIKGTPAPDLQTLATVSGIGSLVVLDEGAEACCGVGTAAGRRIQSFITGDKWAVWPLINDNGRLLLHRMLEWGIGTEEPEPEPETSVIFAAGNADGFMLKWDGTQWIQISTPDNNDIRTIGCGAADFCWAGGEMASKLLFWDGSSWTQVDTPNNDHIYAIACADTNLCWAAGNMPNKILKWNGASWSQESFSYNDDVRALACTDSVFCALGGYVDESIMKWNGSSWGSQLFSYGVTVVRAIECVNSTFCWAGTDRPGALLRWNGAFWLPVNASTTLDIDAIECIDESDCWAGGYDTGRLFHWNGTGWTTVITPNIGQIHGIACLNSNTCWAGGDTSSSLIEWDGSDWTQISTANNGYIKAMAAYGTVSGSGDGGGGPSGPCPGNYADNFNSNVFDNSDGSIDWASSPWEEIGESDGPASGDIQIRTDLGPQRLRTQDNDNDGEGVARLMDLTGATSATFEYLYRRSGLDNENDYSKVEVSSNGISGPWTEITSYQGPDNDGEYQSASHDISDYISDKTAIRFITSPNMGGSDKVWFDNVNVSCD